MTQHDTKTVTIKVLKNGTAVKQYVCSTGDKDKVFVQAMNFAGGKWNGIDTFTVECN